MPEYATWWRVTRHTKAPEPHQVRKETPHYLVLRGGHMEKKSTQLYQWFPTEQEAWDWLLDRSKRMHDKAKRAVDRTAQDLWGMRRRYLERKQELAFQASILDEPAEVAADG